MESLPPLLCQLHGELTGLLPTAVATAAATATTTTAAAAASGRGRPDRLAVE